MSNHEAIDRINELYRMYCEAEPCAEHFEYWEARNMAIEALYNKERTEDDLK